MEERELKNGKEEVKYPYGADLEAKPVPIIDPGVGKTITLRSFDFAIPQNIKLEDFPKDKQKIFNDHSKLISTMLWADGLVPYEGASPRVIINLKKRQFKIIVPAQARLGITFIESPKSLTTMLASRASKNGTSRH